MTYWKGLGVIFLIAGGYCFGIGLSMLAEHVLIEGTIACLMGVGGAITGTFMWATQ